MTSNTKERTSNDGQEAQVQEMKAKIREAWKANEEYILPENNMPLVHLCHSSSSFHRPSF